MIMLSWNQVITTLAYFQFEKDFMEDGIRCIPMMVRFKLDACGIKLKLKEWSKFSPDEKNMLCEMDCDKPIELGCIAII